jgi:cytoskeletal protein RodZ
LPGLPSNRQRRGSRSSLSKNNKVVLLSSLIGAAGAIAAATITIIIPILTQGTPQLDLHSPSPSSSVTSPVGVARHHQKTTTSRLRGSSDSSSSRDGYGGQTRATGFEPTPTPVAHSPKPLTSPSISPSWTGSETVGGQANTWTDYADAGGTEGPEISAFATVQVACRIQGFEVQDGDTWWYRIASSPWSDSFYASADAFYNNGRTSGSLIGTPYVDMSVPKC